MSARILEYLRLGRIFNAEILGIILILSYILTASIHQLPINNMIIVFLFFAGILMHVWGSYNNDRMDLKIDEKADYCKHKPLVSGSISIKQAKVLEYLFLFCYIICVIIIYLLERNIKSINELSLDFITVLFYLFLAFSLAYIYNRFNKSNMLINIVGQMYASFIVLLGMSFLISFDFILLITSIVIGLNGVYLNIIEADIKDIKDDIINVPKALGVTFQGRKSLNIKYFYLLNEFIKVSMFLLVIFILYLEKMGYFVFCLAISFFIINFVIRLQMFRIISYDREKIKPYIAIQELTSILMISTIFMVVNPLLPLIIFLFILLWLVVWNKILWGTYLRPQV